MHSREALPKEEVVTMLSSSRRFAASSSTTVGAQTTPGRCRVRRFLPDALSHPMRRKARTHLPQ